MTNIIVRALLLYSRVVSRFSTYSEDSQGGKYGVRRFESVTFDRALSWPLPNFNTKFSVRPCFTRQRAIN